MEYTISQPQKNQVQNVGKLCCIWLSDFFFMPPEGVVSRSAGANGKALYTYGVLNSEYESLLNIFNEYKTIPSDSKPYYKEWCACYSLAISEIYRREYGGGEWKWEFFDGFAPLPFKNAAQRYSILKIGLEYWKRPLLTMVGGNTYYLGTLFAEGGLPVKLLADAKNGFSDVVAYGIDKYADSQLNYRPLQEYISFKLHRLPNIFRNKDAEKLFVDIVEVLMNLAKKHSLHEHSNPAEYLDTQEENWHRYFPFSLTDQTAKNLVNRWLGQAAEEQKKNTKLQKIDLRHFCNGLDEPLKAEFSFPKQYSLFVPNYKGRTILNWEIYEGNQPVPFLGGTVFARFGDEHEQLDVLFEQSSMLSFNRSNYHAMLSIRFFSDGQLVSQINFPESQIEHESPLIFVRKKDVWQLESTSHYTRISCSEYLIRIPKDFQCLETALSVEATGESWYQVSKSFRAQHPNQETVICVEIIEGLAATQTPKLSGRFFDNLEDVDGLPVYRGWPKIMESPFWTCVSVRVNQKKFTTTRPNVFGTFLVSFISKEGYSLLTKRICVLPDDFQIKWLAAESKHPAKLTIESKQNFMTDIESTQLQVMKEGYQFKLTLVDSLNIPESIVLKVGNLADGYLACLKLPFPYKGAHLFNEHGEHLDFGKATLSLEDLFGKHIAISKGNSKNTQLKLVCLLKPENIERSINLNISTEATNIYLYQFKSILVELFACSQNQDSIIELNIAADAEYKPWLQLNLKRYNGLVVWNNQIYYQGQYLQNNSEQPKSFCIVDNPISNQVVHDVEVNMMCLSDPKKNKSNLGQHIQLGQLKGKYVLDAADYDAGVWMVYPSQNSPVKFRPSIWENKLNEISELTDTQSLHQAARNYHPIHRPDAIDCVIEHMQCDARHPGWSYFQELLDTQYSHLPLSTFETWKCLSKYPDALTLAVLRLGLDDAFCERIRHELAIVWEWIPIQSWQKSIEEHRKYRDVIVSALRNLNLPMPPQETRVLPRSLFGQNEELCLHVEKGFSVQNINLNLLQLLIDNHYNQIRILHQEEYWPTSLNNNLESWLFKQSNELSIWARKFSKMQYDRSVLWLPIFIAFVRVGKAKVEDILLNTNKHQLIDNFYQIYGFDDSWFNYICAITTSYLIGEGE